MTTSLTLDNSLYETALAVAASRGQTLDDFVAEAVQAAVEEVTEPQVVLRDGLPCVQTPPGTPRIDPVQVRCLVEEGVF